MSAPNAAVLACNTVFDLLLGDIKGKMAGVPLLVLVEEALHLADLSCSCACALVGFLSDLHCQIEVSCSFSTELKPDVAVFGFILGRVQIVLRGNSVSALYRFPVGCPRGGRRYGDHNGN